jgi:DNA-binding MarR family transcriptional regulator
MATTKQSPATEAWALLQQLMMGQRTRMLAVAGEFDLAPAQMHALKALEPGKPRPMSELAGALRCDNSNVTGIVDRLEDRGLVRRVPSDRDRRVKMLEVTPAGRGAAQAAARPAHAPTRGARRPQRGGRAHRCATSSPARSRIETRLRVCG